MARAISDEEQQLKRRARRRLIGAIVLVAAIVVVLPMVLDSEPKQSGQQVSVQIPSLDSGDFNSKVVPHAASPGSKTAPQPAPPKEMPAPEEPPAQPGPKTEAGQPAQAVSSKPALKTTGPTAKSADGKFVVQVIALADAGKAQRMQQQISAAGIKAYTEVVKTEKGDVTRVRAGPFVSRTAAEQAREQLKKLGMNGNVTAR
jgi:DedD protein